MAVKDKVNINKTGGTRHAPTKEGKKPQRKKSGKSRVYCRYDMLPGMVQQLIDERLNNPSITYLDISIEVHDLGYEISRSSIGRYALARFKNNQAMQIKLAVAKQQAEVAARMSGGDIAKYAKGAANIVMTEMVNRILSADVTEYDMMDMEDVLKSMSRLIKDMTAIGKLEYVQDKGKTAALAEYEELLDKYLSDEPEMKERLLQLIEEKEQNETNGDV